MAEETEDDLWDLVGHVKAGTHRYDVFVFFARQGAAIPSEVAEETGKSIQRVYDAQKGLERENLIELKVDEDRKKGRIRALTDRGREVWNFMTENGIESEDS